MSDLRPESDLFLSQIKIKSSISRTSFLPSGIFSVLLTCLFLFSTSISSSICNSSAASLSAQEEVHTPYVVIDSVASKKTKGKEWKLTVRGKIHKDVPSGTKVTFVLLWLGQTVDELVYKGSSGNFVAELKSKKVYVSPKPFQFRTEIRLDKQDSKVKKALNKDAERFPAGLAPWTDHHFDKTFQIGSAEDLAASMGKIHEFFTTRYNLLAKIDGEVAKKVEAISEGTEMVTKDDNLESKKWNKWYKDEVLEPIIKAQKEVEDAFKTEEMRPYRHSLYILKQLAGGVALRAQKQQAEVFDTYSIDLSKEQKKPKGLNTSFYKKKRVSRADLGRCVKDIRKQLGIKTKKSPKKPAGDGSKEKK
jgi:hypothetical protein